MLVPSAVGWLLYKNAEYLESIMCEIHITI